MNELESFNSERIYWAVEQHEQEAGDIEDLHLDDNLFYIKSETDKVIAELKEETEKLKVTPEQIMKEVFNRCLIYPKGLVRLDYAYKLAVSLRKQKYKRCLDKAMYWLAVSYQCVDDKCWQRARKHHYKWLELAEKLKVVK